MTPTPKRRRSLQRKSRLQDLGAKKSLDEMDQMVFYEDDRGTRVTSTRFIYYRKKTHEITYAMANITSVEMNVKPANRVPGIILAVLGVLTIAGDSYFGDFDFGDFGDSVFSYVTIAGIVMLFVGVLWAIFVKPSYAVVIGSASGKEETLSERDREHTKTVVDAINEAIIKRG